MPKFLVHVMESRRVYTTYLIEAESEDDAAGEFNFNGECLSESIGEVADWEVFDVEEAGPDYE